MGSDMATQITRRSFLRGTTENETEAGIRPPGSSSGQFQELCNQCGDCISNCPETVISIDANGYPTLDFSDGHCTFCGACAEACQSEALIAAKADTSPWRAKVEPTCWSLNGVTCRMCQDACGRSAIRFQLMTGGRAQPLIELEACTGCGACSTVCPADAISFFEHKPTLREDVA